MAASTLDPPAARQTAPIARRVDEFDFLGAKAETLKLAEALGIDLEG